MTRIVAGLCLTVAVASVTGAQGPGQTAVPAPAGAGQPTVARVGQLLISYEELDGHDRRARQLYRERNGVDIAPELRPFVRRQVLENLIRQRLLALEARRRGVTVSDAEAEALVRQDPAFQQDGMFNEARYLALKAANPSGYAEVLEANRLVIAARKASDQMDRETRPDDAALRLELERELTTSTIDFLALRRTDFDGSQPEPTEAAVLAHYAANAEQYRLPEEVRVDLILFNRPPATDSIGATDAGYRAWEDRMRARADSAYAAIRSGARFDNVALPEGGVKTLTLLRDRQPEPWRGGPKDLAAAFAAAPGSLLPGPVRAVPAWALVRVGEVRPSRIAPLAQVAHEIRRELRARARARADEALLLGIYEAKRDSLRGEGYRIRYALADTSSFVVKEPSSQDLDRYYRAHLVDYSNYDRETGAIVEAPLSEVRDDVRRRWISESRRDLARAAAERLAEAWGRGKRDASLERAMTLVREPGVVPAFGEADTGRAGEAAGTALASRRGEMGVSVTPSAEGYLVLDAYEKVDDYVPTLAQCRSVLLPYVDLARDLELEGRARLRYEADSAAYRAPAVVHFSRLLIEIPGPLDVPLTRAEVERFYESNVNAYSADELVRVRHILIATSGHGALPDAAARARAESLLVRIRAGEEFALLAREYSDDLATRPKGGDVGTFRHGMMREAFERAAFAMRPGDVAGPIRTEVGYHILECLEYAPPVFHPLAQIYGNVAYDCALQKGRRIAAERADSLYRKLRSVAQAKEVAARNGLEIIISDHRVGDIGRYGEALQPYISKIEKLKPGVLYPGVQAYEGLGAVLSWVDHITPSQSLTWEQARDRAVDEVRRERLDGMMRAKRAELDSLAAVGWSFDSLLVTWGGGERLEEVLPGTELPKMGGADLVDSLVFGRGNRPRLEIGRVSDWVEFPGGFARLRVAERLAPDPQQLARRVEQRRQVVLWRNLKTYFDRLKERHPVEILDPVLDSTRLVEPTES